MKIKIFLVFICSLLITYNLNAQRLLGASDGNISILTEKKGLGLSVGFEKFFGENNNKSFQVGIKYLNGKADLTNSKETVPLNDFTFNILGRMYFDTDKFFPYVGIGGYVGYELISDKDLKSSILLDRKNTILYGVQANAGVEYYISVGSIFIETYPFYDFKLKDFYVGFNAGYKYFF